MTYRATQTWNRMKRWSAAALLASTTLAGSGCALIPSWDDVHSATTTVKDTVTGKAREDRLKKTYAEARLLERRKDFAGAESLYRELLKEEPKSRDCYHRLGVIAAVQGKLDEAHQHYQTALQCSTPTPDLWSDIGYCFHLQNKGVEAEQALRQALAIDPQHRAALNNMALVVGEQGRIDEAYDLFRRGNSEAEAEQNTGFLCAACGELDRAQHHFSRALDINADMKPAAEALIQVTQAMQRRQDYLAANGLTPQQQPDGSVVLAGGQPGQAGGVQQTAGQAPIEQRRMIEVYTGGPRLHTPPEAVAPTNAAPAAPMNVAPPAQNFAPQPVAPGAAPVMPQGANMPNPAFPQPASPNGPATMPNMALPAYLQPSSGPQQSETQFGQPTR
ncbi:MAG: tetratricopeptide repeat protein [Planctomycetales bacterium]|nr:tetratricopeptide repeat protein [Planctomycetales bacterium]